MMILTNYEITKLQNLALCQKNVNKAFSEEGIDLLKFYSQYILV